MPNRILKESICTSESIDSLSWFEEVLFYRLMVNCDDFGRFDGRASVIRSRCFPLKGNVTNATVLNAINKLANTGLVLPYMVDEKPYLCLPTWNEHQQIRNKRSKFPDPPADIKNAYDINCNQLISNDSNCHRNPIQSESNPNTNPNTNISAEPTSVSVLIEMPLRGKDVFPITEDMVKNWSSLYPAVDVMQQLRNMVGWCEGNPSRRKTKSRALKFITGWLERDQNAGGGRRYQAQPKESAIGIDFTDLE